MLLALSEVRWNGRKGASLTARGVGINGKEMRRDHD